MRSRRAADASANRQFVSAEASLVFVHIEVALLSRVKGRSLPLLQRCWVLGGFDSVPLVVFAFTGRC